MLKRSVLFICACLCGTPNLLGQAASTASRRADLQIGLGVVGAKSDYDPKSFRGFAFYTTLDLTNHLGAEFVIHQANTSGGSKLYERTYEIGPRYYRTYGRFVPYAKLMYGRGVFNYPNNVANLAYNMFSGGVGADVKITDYLHVRGDYEYQRWISFQPDGLTPQLVTIGVAYHIPGGLKSGKRRR